MRKRRLRKNKIYVPAVICITLSAALLTAGIDKAVRPVASMQAEHFSLLSTNETIEKATADYLRENGCSYSDFAAVLYDENGKAAAVEALTYNINKVQSELSLTINRRLARSSGDYAEIPLGSLTGSYMLAGKGPDIKLKICPAREATVQLHSSFISAGNNQTCHRISAEVTAEIKSSLPLYSFDTKTEFEFLLAENIIVGEVPEVVRQTWSGF